MFISISLISSSRTVKRYYPSEDWDTKYYSLTTDYSYYFQLSTVFDDTFKFRLRLSNSYSKYDLKLYYYCHTWSSDDYIYRTSISPKSSTHGSEIYLEKEIDIDDDYTTLIVEPQVYIDYLYVKLSSENETVLTIVLCAVFIPLGFCILVAVIIFVCVRRCRYKSVVVPPTIQPIQPTITVQPAVQPMYVQPAAYQPPPPTQMQYVPPPIDPNVQYIPPPY